MAKLKARVASIDQVTNVGIADDGLMTAIHCVDQRFLSKHSLITASTPF